MDIHTKSKIIAFPPSSCKMMVSSLLLSVSRDDKIQYNGYR